MKTVTETIHIASDGKRFHDRAKCEQYEADGCVEFEPIPDYGEHVPITEENIRWMCGGDGSCYYATATKRTKIRAGGSTHPEWATHLVYFGK